MRPGPQLALAIVLATGLAACREPNAVPAPGVASASGSPPAPAHATQKRTPASMCNIESFDGAAMGQEAVRVALPGVVRGWLATEDGEAPGAPRLLAVAAGQAAAPFPLSVDIPRPDVAAAFPGRRGLDNSGFELTLHRLDPDKDYHLYLVYDQGDRRFLCDNGRHVMVVQAT